MDEDVLGFGMSGVTWRSGCAWVIWRWYRGFGEDEVVVCECKVEPCCLVGAPAQFRFIL